jgi:hypothetical protein
MRVFVLTVVQKSMMEEFVGKSAQRVLRMWLVDFVASLIK